MSTSRRIDDVKVLELSLHGRLVGYLLGYLNGRNVLQFADEFRFDPERPTFSLITHPNFPKVSKSMSKRWASNQKLPPVLSNLLPEGVMRELVAQGIKTHIDNEFQIFSYLGRDLPGALVATPMEPEDVPDIVLRTHNKAKPVKCSSWNQDTKFSLAGIHMKFSMKEKNGRYQLTKNNDLGDWIVKTPSPKHQDVPLNEFTTMSLAAMAGVDIPQIKLVEVAKLDNLPPINLPDEKLAYAIKRFDREGNDRIHMEDFAQVLLKYSHQKYDSANYRQIGEVIYRFSGDGLADVQQFARRLLVNILLANGDAHLKNWSLWYPGKITPRLSPAYDIVTTSVYIEGETKYALNLGRTKEWFKVTMDDFESWSAGVGVPWRAIKPHLDDTMARAHSLWPRALQKLPMAAAHKDRLKEHWHILQPEFRIQANL